MFPCFRTTEWMDKVFSKQGCEELLQESSRGCSSTFTSSSSSSASSSATSTTPATAGNEMSSTSTAGILTNIGEEKINQKKPPQLLPLSEIDLTPSYIKNFPTANLFPQKVQEVREQIRRTLFRQVLFKIQNVEVTYMKKCKQDRRLVEVVKSRTDSSSTRGGVKNSGGPNFFSDVGRSEEPEPPRRATTTGLTATSSASTSPTTSSSTFDFHPELLLGRMRSFFFDALHRRSLIENLNWLPGLPPLLSGFFSSGPTSSDDVDTGSRGAAQLHQPGSAYNKIEFLREEIWRVDRCEELREYRVRYYREAQGDGFSTFVMPKHWRDKVAFVWYHFWQ
ncbi:unnamed protein product [Amoebophrya sp. A120]|nr:unnamed protein product [Amoebophrya sp. A120]|eukprot:GSA120T00010095001.1